MTTVKPNEDIYNVDKYTDTELYQLLDLNNPSDRELEARIFHLIEKYKTMDTESGYMLAQFFEDIYEHFFELIDDPAAETFDASSQQHVKKDIANMFPSPMTSPNISSSSAVTQMNYSKDYINPILKQTITRIVSIDSQFRNNKKTTLATNFSFNLSDTLRDVVSLRMNSVSIPKTWYTVSNSFGANVFYIKGNSPGINNGLHDYKIPVPPGNYTSSELITELNKSITNVKNVNTDISFGNTGISYFGPDSKATITMYVKSIYNETDYYLHFNSFTYSNQDVGINGIYKSIPSMLGFESQNLDIGTVVSNAIQSYSDNATFMLTSHNNSFRVINYDGGIGINYGDSGFNNVIYNDFTITSSLVTDKAYSRLEIVNDFSAQMHKCIYLLPNQCGIQRVNISDINHSLNGKSQFKFQLYLNKKTTTNAVNQKTVMVTPDDTTIWVGTTSCFNLDTSVNEISTIKATKPYLISDYTIEENVKITATCNAEGYVNSINNVNVNISNETYNLTDYIDMINTNIKTVSRANNNIFNPKYDTYPDRYITGFYVNDNSDYNLRMRFCMKKPFTVDAYCITIADGDYFYTSLGFTNSGTKYTNYDISINTNNLCIISGGVDSETYTISKNTTLFTILPNKTRETMQPPTIFGNTGAASYIIEYTEETIYELSQFELIEIINDTMHTFYDQILNVYPLKDVSLSYGDNGWELDLKNLYTELTATNYEINFIDNNNTNSWTSHLGLDATYILSDYPENYSPALDVSYVEILVTNKKLYKNTLIVYENVNDKITLKAASDGVIDITGGGANDWTITIDAGSYSLDKLIKKLNDNFDKDPKWNGSKIDTKSGNYNTNDYVCLKINSGKVYNTNDYRLVFYDPYSFVNCSVGVSSVRNTTWDTTIGWILGFKELTEYGLSPIYMIPNVNSPSDTYYGDTNSTYTYDTTTNIAIIRGDTVLSVDLFKSFMISLDDYTQNHLNDGVVTINTAENIPTPPSYVNKSTIQCYPGSKTKVFAGTVENNNKNTEKQIYAANQILSSKLPKLKKYASVPISKDIFAIIPINVSKIATGEIIVDNGSGLAKHSRLYFGPVNISRMTIKLLNDRGDIVDLNGSDWSCTLECEQLYQQKSL
jgi:hypothetical protein